MNPSIYQQAIFDHILNPDKGDLFVSAVAGSGKTTTIVEGVKRLPLAARDSTCLVAFNAHIAKELQARLPQGVTAATVHSLGRQALHAAIRPKGRWDVQANKYEKIVQFYYGYVLRASKYGEGVQEAMDALTALTRYAMVTLTDPTDADAMKQMAAHFGLEIPDWGRALEALPEVLHWGIDGLPQRDTNGKTWGLAECISFDDMVYQPVNLGLPVKQFSRLFVDECQDINAAQRAFILKMRADGGRIAWVGDERQAIYGFAGADAESVAAIQRETGAERLPLSVCYRCPRAPLALAREIVPEIEAAAGAGEGVVATIERAQAVSFVQNGDLILCRCTAPLIKLALELITADKPARVRGRDIGKTLTKVIDAVEKLPGYAWVRFGECLERYRLATAQALAQKDGSAMQVEGLHDRCDSVQALYAGKASACQSAGDLRAAIEALFADELAAINLSTVHKAKGLEEDRVLILAPELLPHPMATKDWEQAQEMNLKYVALTRARKELYFVPDGGGA